MLLGETMGGSGMASGMPSGYAGQVIQQANVNEHLTKVDLND